MSVRSPISPKSPFRGSAVPTPRAAPSPVVSPKVVPSPAKTKADVQFPRWLFYLLIGLSVYCALVFFSMFDKASIPEEYADKRIYYYVSLVISLLFGGAAICLKQGVFARFRN